VIIQIIAGASLILLGVLVIGLIIEDWIENGR
jgi:hypothetical protein